MLSRASEGGHTKRKGPMPKKSSDVIEYESVDKLGEGRPGKKMKQTGINIHAKGIHVGIGTADCNEKMATRIQIAIDSLHHE